MKIDNSVSTNPYDSLIIKDSKQLREKFIEHMQEMFDKLERGETQPVYQIGAQAFTLDEWDKFLANFDEAQEAIRAALEEETGHQLTEPETTSITKEPDEVSLLSLASKSTICSHPSTWYQNLKQKEKAEAIKKDELRSAQAQEAIVSSEAEGAGRKADKEADEIKFITWYTPEGIFCREFGQTEGYFWTIPFENDKQYQKVLDYLEANKHVANPRFAADKSFWTAFLAQ